MPARPNHLTEATTDKLVAIGRQIRAFRKALNISATTASQAAGMSRVTLYRIESGEPSVTIGAYFNAMMVLGIDFGIIPTKTPNLAVQHDEDHRGWIPARIRLTDYPQLKQLAWQVHGTDELTPAEALSIYERNWRHVDQDLLSPREKELVEALHLGLGRHHAKL